MRSLTELNEYSDTGVFYTDENQAIVTEDETFTGYAQGYLENKFKINGVIDTNKSVMSNLELVANSAGTWISYDIIDAKWSVIINKAENSLYSFSDDNIIGSISLNGSGLDKLYNAVEVQFPHIDLNNQADYTRIDLLPSELLQNEQINTLNLTYSLVDDPVQAELLGFIELKQSRVDQIVTFKVDYSYLGIKAGTVIDITSDTFGWTNKKFRIIKLNEIESDSISVEITALEYDTDVYDESNLTKYQRSNSDGIIQIGAIGKPSIPQVYKFNISSRPGMYVECAVPSGTSDSGIVEGMEYWIYYMPDSELPNWELIDDETRKYKLASIVAPDGGKVFESGFITTLDIDNIGDSNILVKVRAVNSTTTGPYSDNSGLVEYIPKQVTNAIDDQTEVLDDNWDDILGQIGMTGLMALLNGLLESGDAQQGSMWDTIFGVYSNSTGFDLVNFGNVMNTYSGTGQAVIALAAVQPIDNLPQAPKSGSEWYPITTFTIPKDGLWNIQFIADTRRSGAVGGRGPWDFGELEDFTSYSYKITDDLGNEVYKDGAGGTGTMSWTDFITNAVIPLTEGRVYSIAFSYSLLTPYLPDVTGKLDLFIKISSQLVFDTTSTQASSMNKKLSLIDVGELLKNKDK